ncbi:MAG: hypothetical protein IJS47_06700 [Clostridia bacterium]|nr:hypothetical protein [Clostridia bacterium]
MKKIFMKGFIAGALVFSSVTALAATSYTALKASFPILIDGKTWTTDKPVVVIDGSTYLPLRAIGEVLGVNINWNESARRVEIGETPKTTGLTDAEAKKVINDFMSKNLVWSDSGPTGVMMKLGFEDVMEHFVINDEGSYVFYDTWEKWPSFVMTDIDYKEFKGQILKYVTLNFLNNSNYMKKNFKNVDGKLCIDIAEGSGGGPVAESINRKSVADGTYTYIAECRDYGPGEEDGSEYTRDICFVLKLGEYGSYVVDNTYTDDFNPFTYDY